MFSNKSVQTKVKYINKTKKDNNFLKLSGIAFKIFQIFENSIMLIR